MGVARLLCLELEAPLGSIEEMATEVFEVDVNKTPKGAPPSRLSSSNLTPKTAEEKAQLAEIEEKKKKREQHAEEVKKRKEENKDNPSPCDENGGGSEENGKENGKEGEGEKKAE